MTHPCARRCRACRRPSWGQAIVATGPAHLAGPGRGHPPGRRRGAARLLRRHRPHRPPRERSTWTSPGSSRATTRRGRAAARPTTSTARWTGSSTRPSSTRCSRPRRPSFKDWETSTPYFEGCLPIEVMAERGPRDAALRADEARGPDRPAHRPAASCGGSAAPGQRAGHALQHGRLPDQAEACRAGPRVPA